MPVLNWKQILDETVSGQTLNEVRHCRLPIKSENLLVDVFQRLFAWFFLQVTHSSGIIHELNKPAVIIKRDDVVRSDPELQVFLNCDFVDESDQLHCHVLLSQIVSRFYHKGTNPVTRNVAVRWMKLDLVKMLFPLNSEIGFWQNQRLFFLSFLYLLSSLIPLLQLSRILKTDGFKNQLEWDSFFRRECEALIFNDSH
jgi:hypothetical protein